MMRPLLPHSAKYAEARRRAYTFRYNLGYENFDEYCRLKNTNMYQIINEFANAVPRIETAQQFKQRTTRELVDKFGENMMRPIFIHDNEYIPDEMDEIDD